MERKNKKENDKRYIVKRKALINAKFGSKCAICTTRIRQLHVHRKDGKEHKHFYYYGLSVIMSANADEYVRLCASCHSKVHWCMRLLGMSWEEIHSKIG